MSKRRTEHNGKTYVYLPYPKVNCLDQYNATVGGLVQINHEGKSVGSNVTGWKGVVSGDVFCRDDDETPAKLHELTSGFDVLYVRGHCDAGSDFLESSDHKVRVTVDELVDQLMAGLPGGGLPTTFPGQFKVFACLSGKSSGPFWSRKASFAQRLADAMYAKGYEACRYYGYTESLFTTTYQTLHDATPLFDNVHAVLMAADEKPQSVGHKVVVGGSNHLARASVARVRITPKQQQGLFKF
jgi:hypothetical protein